MTKPPITPPYLLFLGDARDLLTAKTANGIACWRPEWCLGQMRLPGCGADINIEEMGIADAAARNARTFVIGVAPHGGVLPADWVPIVIEAIEAGLDVASGLHSRLTDIPAVVEAARRCGRRIFDVRHPTQTFEPGSPRRRSGKRLLTVGTDCCVGKMFTALAIERDMRGRGMKADFRATGQSGILIAGGGVSIDAVVSDFISGAAEWLSPDNDPDHWDVIEGQGSLYHVSYAGVALGLLHGSQPDGIVLCHDAARTHNDDFHDVPLPSLEDCADANLAAARIANPDVRLVGVALNTSGLAAGDVEAVMADAAARLGVPCCDPLVTGVGAIVDGLE